MHTRVEAIVRGAAGRPLGSLVLYRDRRAPAFAAADERLLGIVAPYLARGLEAEAALVGEFVETAGTRALLGLSTTGELQQLSPLAHKLLLLAHGGMTPQGAAARPSAADFPALATLTRQLLLPGRPGGQPVVMTLDTLWGRFVFEGQLLTPLGDAPAAIHISVEHRESKTVALRRVLAALPVSPAQREVCALLYAGRTQAEIAALLSVAPSTVADPVRSLYRKLDAHSVRELAALIERRLLAVREVGTR